VTDSLVAHDGEFRRYPLSVTQEWFLTLDIGDDGGPFGCRYVIVAALRVTGVVDVGVLQGALDDVVARHEVLRTVVVRDGGPPYQLVCPPCPVPLEVRDLPPTAGQSRYLVFQELVVEVQAGTVSAREVPLLRGLVCRFDDRDSALFVTVHHSVCDGWSFEVILRDLGHRYPGEAAADAAVPRVRGVAAGCCRPRAGRRSAEVLGRAAQRGAGIGPAGRPRASGEVFQAVLAARLPHRR
jgi:hypothetical protein